MKLPFNVDNMHYVFHQSRKKTSTNENTTPSTSTALLASAIVAVTNATLTGPPTRLLDPHLQTQRMRLATADDATSSATLNSSSNVLLGLLPTLTCSANGAGGGERESGQELTLSVGPEPGCLQVLEVGYAEKQPNHSEKDNVSVGNNAQDDEYNNDNSESDTSDSGRQWIGQTNFQMAHVSSISTRTTALPLPEEVPIAPNQVEASDSVAAMVPSSEFFEKPTNNNSTRRNSTSLNKQATRMSTRGVAKTTAPKEAAKKARKPR